MSKKNKPNSGSNKWTSWLKPWAKLKKQSLTSSDPPLTDKKPIKKKSPGNRIQSLYMDPISPKKASTLIQKPSPDVNTKTEGEIPLTPSTNNTAPNPVKLRSLGRKHIAQQPISIPIKKTLDFMIDVLNKSKSTTESPLQNKMIPPSKAPTKVELPIFDVPINEPSNSPKVDSPPLIDNSHPHQVQSLPPISDTLTDIRHIKIWSMESESVDTSGKSTEELFAEAMTLYQLGLSGEKEAVPQAFKLLLHVLQNDRQNLLAEAYLGSVISLMGRDAQDASDRFKFAIKGLKILDKMVSRVPEHVEIRGMRAFVCAKLPEQFFHRSDTAVEDFSYLVSRYEEDESLFPKEFYSQILYELALAYHRLGQSNEAKSTCHKLLSLTTDSKYKILIKQEGIFGSNLPRWQRQPERKSKIENDWSKLKYDEKFQEGIELHNRAIADDQYALEKAHDIFKHAHKMDPQDPLIKAYYADCLSLLGLTSSDTSIMFRHATHSIKTLDQAVNSSPEDITIRFIRGYNSYRIPEAFFRRTLTAIRDFEYIIQRFEKDSSILPEETYWQILYDLGDAYERLEMSEEAHSTWQKLSQCGDTPYQEFVDELLSENTNSFPNLNSEQTSEGLLQEGIRLHEQGIAGNKKMSAKAYEILLKAHEADITNPIAQGYLGSSMAVFGQSATDPSEVYHYFFKGMNHLKKAIANDPNNYTLHLLLAKVMYHYSPSFFRGNEKIIKEFKFLKLAYERDPNIFPEADYLQILYDLGACYQRSGDPEKAKKCWEKLSKLTINPKYKLPEVDQEGATNMDKDKIRDKFKEIAEDIAQEKAKEKSKEEKTSRKEKKHSKEIAPEKSAEATEEKPRRKHKDREKEKNAPIITETTRHKRKKDRTKEELAPVAAETSRRKTRKDREKGAAAPLVTNAPIKLSPEEKKARREEKEKARAAALEKAMSRAKRVKKEETPPEKPAE